MTKKLLASTAALALLLSLPAQAAPPWIAVQGRNLVADGKPIQLHGVNLGNWMLQEDFMFGLHGTHSQMRAAIDEVLGKRAAVFWDAYEDAYFTERDAAWLQQRGFNLLRVPLNQHRLENANQPGQLDPEALARIDRLIARAARHGIYVMLDLHAVAGGQSRENYADADGGEPVFWRYAALREQSTRLWEALARRYRDNPAVAGYDLINEPQTEGRTPLLTAWLRETLQRVRKIDRRHVVWLSGDEWGGGLVGITPEMLDAPQVAFQFHIYPSFTYPWQKMRAYPDTVDGVRYDAAWLRQRLGAIIEVGRKHPVLLGETGMSFGYNREREPLLQAALSDMLALATEQQWSWAQWSLKDVGQMGMLTARADSPWRRLIRSEAAQAERAKLGGLIRVRYLAAGEPAVPAAVKALSDREHDLKVVNTKVQRAFDPLLSRAIAQPMAAMSDTELRALAQSFSFENCDQNNVLAETFERAARP